MLKEIFNAAAERSWEKTVIFNWSRVDEASGFCVVAFVFFLFNRELLNLFDLGFKYWNSYLKDVSNPSRA